VRESERERERVGESSTRAARYITICNDLYDKEVYIFSIEQGGDMPFHTRHNITGRVDLSNRHNEAPTRHALLRRGCGWGFGRGSPPLARAGGYDPV